MTDTIETNTVVCMVKYQHNVKLIGDYLYNKFYRHDQFDEQYSKEVEDIAIQRCLEKAERVYKFFDSVQEVKRMVEFLNTVNPGMAKEMVDGL